MTLQHYELFAVLAVLFIGAAAIGIITSAIQRIYREIKLARYNETVDRR